MCHGKDGCSKRFPNYSSIRTSLRLSFARFPVERVSVLLRYVCPYGGKMLFFPFEKRSAGLEWIARTKLGPPHIIHILDDFVIIDKTLSACSNRVQQFW